MARVTGPLMSMEASGTVGKTLTFANWVGRQYVRRWARPANPQTTDQMAQRNAFSVIGVGISWANKCLQVNSSTTKTDEAALRAKTPSGMRWNGYTQKLITGSKAAGFGDAKTAWGLISGSQSSWETAATSATPPLGSAPQYLAGGTADTPATPGFVLFCVNWALYMAGERATAPDSTPPTYS